MINRFFQAIAVLLAGCLFFHPAFSYSVPSPAQSSDFLVGVSITSPLIFASEAFALRAVDNQNTALGFHQPNPGRILNGFVGRRHVAERGMIKQPVLTAFITAFLLMISGFAIMKLGHYEPLSFFTRHAVMTKIRTSLTPINASEKRVVSEVLDYYYQARHLTLDPKAKQQHLDSVTLSPPIMSRHGKVTGTYYPTLGKIAIDKEFAQRFDGGPGFRLLIAHELAHSLGLPKDAIFAESYAIAATLAHGGFSELFKSYEEEYGNAQNNMKAFLLGAKSTTIFSDPVKREKVLIAIAEKGGNDKIPFDAKTDDLSDSQTTALDFYQRLEAGAAWAIARGNPQQTFDFLLSRGSGNTAEVAEKATLKTVYENKLSETDDFRTYMQQADRLFKEYEWPHPQASIDGPGLSPRAYEEPHLDNWLRQPGNRGRQRHFSEALAVSA